MGRARPFGRSFVTAVGSCVQGDSVAVMSDRSPALPPPSLSASPSLSPVLSLARVLSLRIGLDCSLVCVGITPLVLAPASPIVGLACLCLAALSLLGSVLRGARSLVLSLGGFVRSVERDRS